jgi:thioredoxin reductase
MGLAIFLPTIASGTHLVNTKLTALRHAWRRRQSRDEIQRLEEEVGGARTRSGKGAPRPRAAPAPILSTSTSNSPAIGRGRDSISDHGSIPVDKQMRTNVPHIYAIGDIAGQPMLAHKASHEGEVATTA